MSNEAKKQLTEEERLRNDKRRASADRLEAEGDAFIQEEKLEEAADRWFRCWELRTYLMSSDPKNESWDDFIRISLKYGDVRRELGQYDSVEVAGARILYIAVRSFEKDSPEFIAAAALCTERFGLAKRLKGQAEDAVMEYESAAWNYGRAGNAEKSDECLAIAAELRQSL